MRRSAERIILILTVLFSIFGCQGQNAKPKEKDLVEVKSNTGKQNKKVIYLLVDSLMASAIDQGIQQNELPTFKNLIDHGQYYKNVVSSFPTMSVTIDSSLMTGTYPDGHHIPGLVWYSSDEKKVINYGTGPKVVLKHGINPVMVNALVNMNGKHLNPRQPTIYEEIDRMGLKSGSINGLIYRGAKDHTLSIPPWIEVPTTLPKEIKVKGPDYLALGSLTNPLEGIQQLPDSLPRRMGLNNSYSLETAKYLVQANQLPDFLYVYLPDLDQKLHKNGPSDLKGVKETDQQLKSLLQSFGSVEEALKQAVFIVSGDSGMTRILDNKKESTIDLTSLFQNFKVLKPGDTATNDTQIALAVNETMAYVYRLNTSTSFRDLAKLLLSDNRIDFVSWKDNGWIHTAQGQPAKELKYKAGGPLTDSYHQQWTIQQNPEILDLQINTTNQSVQYGKYPDALQRLSGALHSHPGDFLVVTTKPGYELTDKSSPTHTGGGGHGSLHEKESLIPLIITGTDQQPKHLRIIDLKSYLLNLLSHELRRRD